jgi:hypothetical protein
MLQTAVGILIYILINMQPTHSSEVQWLGGVGNFSTSVLAFGLAAVQISSSTGTADESICRLGRNELHQATNSVPKIQSFKLLNNDQHITKRNIMYISD